MRAGQLLIVMSLALLAPAAALLAGLSDDELERAWAGEILLQTIDIISYRKYAFVYIRGLKQCEVLESGLHYTRMHHRLRSS